MKARDLLLLSLLFSVGGGGVYWLGKSQAQNFAVVDVQKIVSQTAETLAQQNSTPDQVQFQILQFKADLQTSLKEFARQKNLLIIPTHSLFGNVADLTEKFIQFYNEGISS
jgi:hypothetical protein